MSKANMIPEELLSAITGGTGCELTDMEKHPLDVLAAYMKEHNITLEEARAIIISSKPELADCCISYLESIW